MVEITRTPERIRRGRIVIIVALEFLCLFLALFAHKSAFIGAEYTHLFYIPIILTALWFHKAAYATAALLGTAHIVVEYLSRGTFDYATAVRFFFFLFVAGMVSEIAGKMDGLAREVTVEK